MILRDTPRAGGPVSRRAALAHAHGAAASLGAASPPFVRQPRAYLVSRRALDIVLASVLLLLCSPVLCLAALAILVTTGQDPLFVQRRVGLLGREFGMLKLRTMDHRGAQGPLERLAPGDVLVLKLPGDSRVTRAGRWLRATSIDELPQLLNVLAGTMSLVGPRPALPDEVARYPVSWRRRLEVKPGLTGLWQVSGRCEIAPKRRAALDRYYVAHRGLRLDCAILLRTAAAVLSMRGAW